MNKVLYIITTLFLFSLSLQASMPDLLYTYKRPKVAVVLSGGGAKGTAHVGALKVIEEAGVPIDMIVGTSMGAIIGGLYSVGHTPECLDSILRAQDWTTLLTDRKKEQELSFLAREREDKYIINIPLEKNTDKDSLQSINAKAGIIEGRNVVRMFQKLIPPEYEGNINFGNMPTRFACVAVDVTTGKEIVFHNGRLDTAMRASMSIPGVFKPIRQGNMLLIDGGILNNYPVDVARKMGADIIIGVDVNEGLYEADRIKNMMDIVNQITSIYETGKHKKNINDTDIYIKVNTKGYTMASFTNDAIDTLLLRGEVAARRNFNKLQQLGSRLGGNSKYLANRGKHYEKEDSTHDANIEYIFEPFPADAIGFSANFNQEEMASLIMQAYKTHPFFNLPSQVGATIRLGKRYKFKFNLSTMLSKGLYIDFNYEVGYNDIRFNQKGTSFANTTFSGNIVTTDITKSWRWAKIEGGIRFNNYNFKSLLIEKNQTPNKFTDNMDGSTNYWDFHVNLGVNTTNKKRFATKGLKLDVEANAYRGHKIETDGGHSIYSIRTFGTFYTSPTNRLTIIPSVYFRSLNKRSYIYGISNVAGGEWVSHYLSSQIPFYGLGYIEWKDRSMAVARIQARYRIGKNHYVTGIFNVGNDGDGFEDIIDTKPIYGYGLNYSYDSFVGPLGFTVSSSNVSKKVNLLISLGYIF